LLADTPSLQRLGWSDQLETKFEQFRAEGLAPARVVAQHRGAYVIHGAAGEASAEITGRMRHAAASPADLPAVGDWVAVRPRPEGEGTIVHAVLPRRTVFSRKTAWAETVEQIVAANVDVAFLVTTLTAELSARRLERYLTTAWESGADPVIVLNKADLCEDPVPLVAEVEAVAIAVPIVLTSARTGAGVEELRSRLGGRHTTTHRELIPLPGGGLLLDTPGMRELQLWEADEGLDTAFEDVAALAAECRFSDCAHGTEPGCAIRAALASGTLARERYDSYRKLQSELARLERRLDKRLIAEERKKRRAFARSQRRTAW
jgi:ribosome biogenesis GTPase